MTVTFNQDEKTATSETGTTYKIRGLIIRKPKEGRDVLYPLESSMCRAVIFPGLKSAAVDVGGGEIDLV